MGVKKGLEYVESELNNGTEAIFVTKDPLLNKKLTILDLDCSSFDKADFP